MDIRQLIIISSVSVFFLFLIGCTGNINTEDYNSLAICLSEKNVTMYGTEWCSHCQNQKRAFGDSFQYIDFIDCDQNQAECLKAGVEGYPTWSINNQNYPGEQPLERLAALAGCDI